MLWDGRHDILFRVATDGGARRKRKDIEMHNSYIKTAALGVAITVADALIAGVPLNNLQGTGGIAFNPLASTAGLPWDGDGGGDSTNAVEHSALNGKVSRPQIGAWYVNLNDAGIN